MRAVSFREFGSVDVLEVAEVPVAEPGPGQVRIAVRAAAVNPVDLGIRAGWFTFLPERPWHGLGWDVAGTVDALGAGVTEFAVGDAVLGLSHYFQTFVGTHAEYAVLNADAIASVPAGVDMIGAATLPLNGLAAAQALNQFGLSAGATLAITGAAGAVGGYAAQLAVQAGLTVYGIAGERDAEFVRGVGATFVPRADDPAAAVRARVPGGVDGLLDAARLGPAALRAVRDHGVFVNLTPEVLATERGIRSAGTDVRADGRQLADLATLAGTGALTIRVAEVLPLTDAAKAHEMLAAGGVRGRVVLVP